MRTAKEQLKSVTYAIEKMAGLKREHDRLSYEVSTTLDGLDLLNLLYDFENADDASELMAVQCEIQNNIEELTNGN